jgi:predicted tellurium resistance membrane protein TerC
MFEALTALVGLSAMEIVLGIDNVVFIAIVVARLPAAQQPRARSLGLMLALLTRIGLLFTLSWMMTLTHPFFTLAGVEISGRSLILLLGGLFLIAKSTHEIHAKVEGGEEKHAPGGRAMFGLVLVQIAILDIVFSLDSVVTAVGMASSLWIMITAMVIAMLVMLVAAGPIGDFVNRHPTMKVLALSFLILIGVMLVAEGLGKHVEKGYIYFAMAFSLLVELLNMRMRKKRAHAHQAASGGTPLTA